MNSPPSDQLDLLGSAAPSPDDTPSRAELGIVLDYEGLLAFLSSEWLFPEESGHILLGLGLPRLGHRGDGNGQVVVWFDRAKLPPVGLLAWRDGAWSTCSLSDLGDDVKTISWNGPLPLFAVERFTVDSLKNRSHLLVLVGGFDDVVALEQPIEVGSIASADDFVRHPATTSPMVMPRNWDALRGAAAMAVWGVPSIDPWLDLLCRSLSAGEPSTEANWVQAPWWRQPLWSCRTDASTGIPALWQAIVSELSRPGLLKEWRPAAILDAVCVRARALGESEERLARLTETSLALLDDQGTVDTLGLKDDTLGLALQLLLLRPAPERFIGWREEWPGIPPGAWWTGVTLSGYLKGYRLLSKDWRGTPQARRGVALRTWMLSCGGSAGAWEGAATEPLTWAFENELIHVRDGKGSWTDFKISPRGRWYRADFTDATVEQEAKALALHYCPDTLTRVLILNDVSLGYSGGGKPRVDSKTNRLVVKGKVVVTIDKELDIESQLEPAKFRNWLATASIAQRMPRPPAKLSSLLQVGADAAVEPPKPVAAPAAAPALALAPAKRATVKRVTKATQASAPQGLTVVEDFISQAEERELLSQIDAQPWLTTLKRRVQHYGWKYDYKARRVNENYFIGELPDWAKKIAERLLERDLVKELPDQVIVNNYEGSEAISKHIDCPECFRGAVVTVSLNEAWEMVFTRKLPSGEQLRFGQVLPRRSAAVLDGDARSKWLHEIPSRLTERGIVRGRRVSITFRRVDHKISV
jgi:alkylated DNA repair dioxygenase AlkB